MQRLYPDPDVSTGYWSDVEPRTFSDWTWQLKNRVSDPEILRAVIDLTEPEAEGLARTRGVFRFAASPYYALLADPRNPDCPVRRQMVPRPEEATIHAGQRADPLGEEEREVVPNLIHRYPDRVLLLATDRCPVYCRFCTRRRIVGRIERQATRALLREAFEYIHATPGVREVIVSGGDALMLADRQLDYVLESIRSAPHVDIIRIATRMPVTCPMRVTPALAEIFARHGPTYVMTHFNHPRECTPSASRAIDTLIRAGVPVWNQSVLLKGINDSVDTIAELNRLLVWMKAVPYYLHQCDLAEGIEHFRTPLATGIDIIDGLRGHVSGLMVPKFAVDVPGGLGKVTVQPEWIVRRQGAQTIFRTYSGKLGEYVDPT